VNLQEHFKKVRDKRQVHIAQLCLIRDQTDTDERTRCKLNKKISYERQQLAAIDEIWNVG
jgi:hypothetical protein